jgi:hypothetical protein
MLGPEITTETGGEKEPETFKPFWHRDTPIVATTVDPLTGTALAESSYTMTCTELEKAPEGMVTVTSYWPSVPVTVPPEDGTVCVVTMEAGAHAALAIPGVTTAGVGL